MSLLQKLCSHLTALIKKTTKEMDEEKLEVINYGIYLILSDILKNSILIVIAYILGIMLYCVITMISFMILRSLAGGVHAKTWLGCLITNLVTILGTVYFGKLLSNINLLYLCILMYPLCFAIFYLYAPSDHENKPIVSNKQLRYLKALSLTILTSFNMTAIILNSHLISEILILTPFAVAIAILPLTYRITGNKRGDAYPQL